MSGSVVKLRKITELDSGVLPGARRNSGTFVKSSAGLDIGECFETLSVPDRKFQVSLLVNNRGQGTLAKISSMLAHENARVEYLDFKPCTRRGMAQLKAQIALGPEACLERLMKAARQMPEIRTASISEKEL